MRDLILCLAAGTIVAVIGSVIGFTMTGCLIFGAIVALPIGYALEKRSRRSQQ